MTDKEFAVIGREAVFLMRGTIEDLCNHDMSQFRDGREFIMVLLPAPKEDAK